MINLPKPDFSAEFNPDFVHITPALFYMRGEHENGEKAGLLIGFGWLGVQVSVVFC